MLGHDKRSKAKREKNKSKIYFLLYLFCDRIVCTDHDLDSGRCAADAVKSCSRLHVAFAFDDLIIHTWHMCLRMHVPLGTPPLCAVVVRCALRDRTTAALICLHGAQWPYKLNAMVNPTGLPRPVLLCLLGTDYPQELRYSVMASKWGSALL
jgi:hypothetical protein